MRSAAERKDLRFRDDSSLVVVVNQEFGPGQQSVFGPDVDAISNCHEFAVAIRPVPGVDEPGDKMTLRVPGIGTSAGGFGIEANIQTGHPLDVMIPLTFSENHDKMFSEQISTFLACSTGMNT